MEIREIFALQFVFSLVVFSLLAKWYLAPWLKNTPPKEELTLLLIPHAFRHIGMVFLVPGVVYQTLPSAFAYPAAYGDLVSGILALISMVALRAGWGFAIPLVWLFNVVGTLDLLNALRHVDVAPGFGAAWYIPTFVVPLLLVTHYMIFARLLKRT